MFKPQPPSHAFAFTAGVFCASILVCVLILLRRTLSVNLATIFFLSGPYAIGALLSGLFFWLGLGFSQREPLPRRAFFQGFFVYAMSLNILTLFGHGGIAQWASFILFLLLPLPIAARWPQMWSFPSPSNSSQHVG
jgi:hypothetical protein